MNKSAGNMLPIEGAEPDEGGNGDRRGMATKTELVILLSRRLWEEQEE